MNRLSQSSANRRIETAILLTALLTAVVFPLLAEPRPKPIYSDNAPVCSWESLSNVALPNTTIDSVTTLGF